MRDSNVPINYQAEAQQTLSDQWHGEHVDKHDFLHAVSMAVRALHVLDAYKKALYYGDFRALKIEAPQAIDSATPLPSPSEMSKKDCDVIHALLGHGTESGELLDILPDVLLDNLDELNAMEEFGDAQWYTAVAAEALGTTIEKMQVANIAKLRERFPNKFTAYDAQNRDLFNERATLDESMNGDT